MKATIRKTEKTGTVIKVWFSSHANTDSAFAKTYSLAISLGKLSRDCSYDWQGWSTDGELGFFTIKL